MSGESSRELKAEIGHVLLIDIVGYSKLLITEQGELLETLKQLVQETEPVRLARSERDLIRLPTGDGMALIFRNDAEAPLECALQLGAAVRRHPELRLRMGIHSGPIREVRDVNERANLAGAAIDVGQRVMDCGDAGHIIVSKRVADALRLAQQAADSLPIARDALVGPVFALGLAQIQARTGHSHEAVKTLRYLLSIPAGWETSLPRLRIDPVWDPIRNDLEFQQLLESKEKIGPNE